MGESDNQKLVAGSLEKKLEGLRVSDSNAILPSLDDTLEILARKSLMRELAFTIELPNPEAKTNPKVPKTKQYIIHIDRDNNGEPSRTEVNAIINNEFLQGILPKDKMAELKAMADPGNDSGIVSNSPDVPVDPSAKAVTFSRPKFEFKQGESVVGAAVRRVIDQKWYIEAAEKTLDSDIGKRFVRLDVKPDYIVTVDELHKLSGSPEVRKHLDYKDLFALLDWEMRRNGAYTLSILNGWKNAKDAQKDWPSDISALVDPLLNDGSGKIETEVQSAAVGALNKKVADCIAGISNEKARKQVQEAYDSCSDTYAADAAEAAQLSNYPKYAGASPEFKKILGAIGFGPNGYKRQDGNFHQESHYLGYSTHVINRRIEDFAGMMGKLKWKGVIGQDQEEQLVKYITACEQAKSVIIFEGNMRERLGGNLPEMVSNRVIVSKSEMENGIYRQVTGALPDDPEVVSRFENKDGTFPGDFIPKIRTIKAADGAAHAHDAEQKAATYAFDKVATIPIVSKTVDGVKTKNYDLDFDKDRILRKSEVDRVLGYPNAKNVLSEAQFKALQTMSESSKNPEDVIIAEKDINVSLEAVLAVESFEHLTRIVVGGAELDLDTNSDGVLTNLEASRNLNTRFVQKNSSLQQKATLRDMVNGTEVVESIEHLERMFKTTLVSGGTEESTKQFIELHDMDNNKKLSVGEALHNAQKKGLATAQVISKP